MVWEVVVLVLYAYFEASVVIEIVLVVVASCYCDAQMRLDTVHLLQLGHFKIEHGLHYSRSFDYNLAIFLRLADLLDLRVFHADCFD